MTDIQAGQWPKYTYIVPQIYTRAKVRLIGLGNYAPPGTITNEFFAYISTRLGDPRTANDHVYQGLILCSRWTIDQTGSVGACHFAAQVQG